MKLIYSLFMLTALGLLVDKLSSSELPLISASKKSEINRRLDAIKYL